MDPNEELHARYKAEGDEHARARRYAEANDSYTLALEQDHTQHATWSNRSLVRLKLWRKEEAAADAHECTRLAPNWPKGWARVGAAEVRRRHCPPHPSTLICMSVFVPILLPRTAPPIKPCTHTAPSF